MEVLCTEGVQRHTDQRRVRLQLDLEQLGTAAGKGIHLNGGRKAQKPRNFRGAGKLRIDGHGQTEILPEEIQLCGIFRIAHAGDGVARADLFGHQTAQQIQFIRRGGGNQQIRFVHTGLNLDGKNGPIAVHAHNIKRIGGRMPPGGVVIDDGNIVPFVRELFSQCAADFAVADDNDFHSESLALFLL